MILRLLKQRHSKSVSTIAAAILFSFLVGCDQSSPNRPAPPKDPIVVNEFPKAPTIISQQQLDLFKDKRKVVLMISIDGFRFDYLKNLNVPNLKSLMQSGVSTEGLIPSFPTLTFPNHISLVTGRTPGHHGIVSNTFYDKNRKETYSMGDGKTVNDGSWYKGEPIWTVVEQAGIKTATCFWVGSEAKINGIDPTYIFPYDGKVTNIKRAEKVIEWLKLPDADRPQFITLYFSDVDSAGHSYGPDSKQVLEAAADVDAAIGKIMDHAKQAGLDMQYIAVSDHGMNVIETQRVSLYDAADLRDVTITEKGATTQIYSDNATLINKIYADLKKNQNHYTVYRRGEVPARWKFDEPNRTGDLVVVADFPYYIDTQKSFLPLNDDAQKQVGRSTHGWDPANGNMHGLFLAQGSFFKSNMKIARFENVHIYPMVLSIFGLKQSLKIDGDPSVLDPIIKKAKIAE